MPTAHQLFKNNADSTVNGTIAIGASFFNVAPGHGTRFPTPSAGQYFLATLFEKNVGGDEINFEIVKVTSVTGDTLTVVRDFEGIVVGNGGTSGGWAYPSAVGINPSQIVYVQLRFTAYGAGNALAKDGNLVGLENAATARTNLGVPAAASPSTNGTLTHSGDVVLSGSGKRITGDFSNATVANRVMFQTSTLNQVTALCSVPNGSATSGYLQMFGASDTNNAPIAQYHVDGEQVALSANKIGSGTYLPMTFWTGGAERMRIDTSGNVGIGIAASYALHVNKDAPGANTFIGVQNTSATANSQAGLILFEAGGGGDNYSILAQNVNGNTYLSNARAGGAIGVITGGAERLRIGADGNVSISKSLHIPGGGGLATNEAFGTGALQANTTGNYNTASGAGALQANTTGYGNTASGVNALQTNTTGNYNTASGAGALQANTTGHSNTASGVSALQNNTTYSNCSGLGRNAEITGDNQVQLGDSATTTYVYGTVQNRSDLRDKADVRDTQLGLDFVMSLRPVDYRLDMREDYRPEAPAQPTLQKPTDEEADDYQEQLDAYEAEQSEHKAAMDDWLIAVKPENIVRDGSKKRTRYHHGFIAQEVMALDAGFGGVQDHSKKGGEDVLSIGYDELIAPLVKAMQELKAEFDAYKVAHP